MYFTKTEKHHSVLFTRYGLLMSYKRVYEYAEKIKERVGLFLVEIYHLLFMQEIYKEIYDEYVYSVVVCTV